MFTGELATETMLVQGVNDDAASVAATAAFLAELRPAVAYIAIPIRPPAESWVRAPDEVVLHRAYHLFDAQLDTVEYLIGYEGNAFMATGDVEQDVLGITAVHPMREEAVLALLARAGADRTVLDQLIAQGKLIEVMHDGKRFYVRRFSKTVRSATPNR